MPPCWQPRATCKPSSSVLIAFMALWNLAGYLYVCLYVSLLMLKAPRGNENSCHLLASVSRDAKLAKSAVTCAVCQRRSVFSCRHWLTSHQSYQFLDVGGHCATNADIKTGKHTLVLLPVISQLVALPFSSSENYEMKQKKAGSQLKPISLYINMYPFYSAKQTLGFV